MKKLSIITALLLVALAIFGQTKTDLQFIEQTLENRGEIVLRFPHNGNRELVNEFAQIMSIDKINGTYVEAYANASEYELFKTYGIAYEPVYEYYTQTRAINMATTVAQMANWDRYPTYAVYLEMMRNYARDYPTLCKMDTIGFSVNNRPIINMTISDNVGVDEDEPEFWWSSTMHGDETTGWYFMIRLVDELLTKYGTDAQITNLVDNVEIYISPNTNPDGTFYGSNNGTSMTNARRANANNVDLNRNFPPISGTVSSGNQPEITMMTAYADAHNFVMSANGHGGTECLNYPWDQQNWFSYNHPHPDTDWWLYICQQYADTCHALNSSFLTGPGTMADDSNNSTGITEGCDWYYTQGGRQDYMNYYHHCKEITMEWSNTKKLDCEYLNTYWGYNRNAILTYTEQVLYGFRGIVTDGCTNQPLSGVKVFVNNHDADNSEVYTAAPVGDYHRPIYAGTYSVTFSKDGYIPQTFEITTQNMASVRLDVTMYPEGTILPEFTADNTTIFEGSSVQFTNTTSGNYVSASWSFEGGSPATSNETNATVTYDTHGTYDATLTIVNTNGCSPSATKEDYITVYEAIAPEADFSASETNITAGESVTFSDLSTNIPTSWSWTFEGGTPATSTEQNPTVTYSEAGEYTVTLVATNAFGSDTETKTEYISVVAVYNMSNDPIYACGGTYKDPGGDGNYGNNARYTQTIYPSSDGAYVRLTFTQLGLQQTTNWGSTTCNDYITIYDGTTTSATQIGQYCGTDPTAIGTNGVVTATNSDGALTIYFYSNNSTVNTGWEAEISCYAPEPEATFSAEISENCTRNIATTNESEYATSYLWDFGDGTTSTETAPTHTYVSNGTYTITLTATNSFGNSTATQQIEILAPEITSVSNANGCGNTSITLSAEGAGTLHWFDSQTNGNELGTGNSYTNTFAETTTVYVESQIGSEESYNVGLASNTSGTTYNQNQNTGLKFTVSQSLTLVSVDVYCSQNNQSKTITITNSSSQTVYSQAHTLASGLNTLTLNVALEPGTYNIYTNGRYTYRNSQSFPYTVNNVISITGQYNSGYGTQYYYTFYNWVVKVGNTCTSERTAVTATVTESGTINLGEPIIQCSGTATLDAGNGFDNYAWSNEQTTQSITIAQSGTYTVTATNGQCESTGSIVVTINPVPSVSITENGNQLTANATLGTGNYNYIWSTEATTQSITISSDGNYCVTATDENGCSASECDNTTLPDIDITISEAEHGSIDGETSAEYGSDYTFTVSPDNCYEVVSVTVNGTPVTPNENNIYTIANVTEPQSISATFSQISYSVTASAGNGGSINGTPTSVNCGEGYTFTVTPNDCYEVASVTVNGTPVTPTNNIYTIANVTEPQSINATFSQISYAVTTSSGNGGTINNIPTSVNCGEGYTFTVTPNDCYEVASVTVNGTLVTPTNNIYTIANVTEPQNINATFSQISYTITASAGNGGTINDIPTSVNCGEGYTFTVTPNDCYEVASVTVNGTPVTPTNNIYTISNVTEPQNINATFSQISYTITASAGNGGTITPNGTSTVACGESLTYTITSNSGYMISDLRVDGASVGSQSSYSFTNINANHTISATFELIPLGEIVIVVNAENEGGSVSPTGTQTITEGDDFTFTVTPDECHTIGTVTVNGTQVTLDANNSYTIENVTTEQNINVVFDQIMYAVSANAGNGGTIVLNGGTEVGCDENKTFTVTPDDCHIIGTVTVNGTEVNLDGNNSYTITNVTADQIINASFTQISYTIAASAGNGGTITPAGNVEVECGGNKTFAITADEGYEIENVTVDGQSYGAIASYTFENVTENGHSIEATFNETSIVPECNAVTNLTATIESYGIVLSWDAAENAVSYNIYRNGERIATETNTSAVDLQGHEGDSYYIITNCGNGGTSDASETATATAEPTCNAITDLTARVESYGIVLSWNEAENAISYEIYRNGNWISTETSTSAIDLQGHEGDSYYIITNCGNGGTSDASETATATITGIDEIGNSISIYPNPASDMVEISANESINRIEVVSAAGQVMHETEVNGESVRIDVENLPSGTYFVRIFGNSNVIVKKLVVM